VITLEESVLAGGFGSAVLEALAEAGLADLALRSVPVRTIGLAGGRFVDHGSVSDLRRLTRLDVEGIEGQVREAIGTLRLTPARPISTLEARSA
jgi:1-deoxy-D-xylulose-5-phosphate synthase